ncbi:MAG: class IV adenylate cyclase [Saprospiraceae bacterium]|nr:class IV adenylate cyclase [Saprospiraceae bacterium]
MLHLNIEIKAQCTDSERIRAILLDQNARFIGEDHQIDTYFQVPYGRLKLREGTIENALIHYSRNDQSGPKKSEVLLYQSQPGSSLKTLLAKSLGILAVVDKRRAIFFIDNVKFHIDRVNKLGSFIEIEAIAENNNKAEQELLSQCQYYMQLLGIRESDLLTHSYSDMIIKI